MIEMATLVAALALALGAIAGGLAVLERDRVRAWPWIALRATSIVALTVALVARVGTLGQWSPYDQELNVLGLVLAMLIVHSVLAWALGLENSGPLAELAGLGVLLIGAARLPVGAPLLNCPQEMAAFQIQWLLFLLGGGSLIVAGCAGLTVVLGKVAEGRGRDLHLAPLVDLYALVVQAAGLAWLALGGGLTISLWWTWQALGTLTSGDPRAEWMALTWLLTAMSLLAGQLERHPRRWVIGLSILAASNLVFGWLLVVGALGVLGF